MGKRTRREISEIEKGGSLFVGICNNLQTAVTEVGVSGVLHLLSTPEGLPYLREMVQKIKDNKKFPTSSAEKVVIRALNPILQANIDCCQDLAELFGVDFDPAAISWPKEASEEGYWVIPQFAGVAAQQLVNKCREKFGGKFRSYYDDLDQAIVHNDRDANQYGTYVVVVRANVEADEEYKYLPAKQLWQEGFKGITLPERLMLGLMYFLFIKTGQHLEMGSVTLCSGSRYANDHVPGVGFGRDCEVDVDWYYPDESDDDLRVRQIVSSSLQ